MPEEELEKVGAAGAPRKIPYQNISVFFLLQLQVFQDLHHGLFTSVEFQPDAFSWAQIAIELSNIVQILE